MVACHAILHIVDPRILSVMASHDVVNFVSQARMRGVTRSKRRAMQSLRKAAENGNTDMSLRLAARMYANDPYAREVGRVEEAAEVAAPAGVIMQGHDLPLDVLTGVVHWLRKGCLEGRD